MAKYDFWKTYQGPRGAHLNCLTKYTLSKELDDKCHVNRSSDGASHKGRKRDNSSLICERRNPNRKGHLARASKELNRRRITLTGKAASHPAFKLPGSMQL